MYCLLAYADDVTVLKRVEDVVIAHYQNNGYPKGTKVRNCLLSHTWFLNVGKLLVNMRLFD